MGGISEVSSMKLGKYMVKHRWTMFFFSHGFISWHEVNVVGWMKKPSMFANQKSQVNTLWWSDLPQLEAFFGWFLIVTVAHDSGFFGVLSCLKSENIEAFHGIWMYLDLWEKMYKTILERKVESKKCCPQFKTHSKCQRCTSCMVLYRLKTWLTA